MPFDRSAYYREYNKTGNPGGKQQRAYYANNRESILKIQREYRQKNKEKVRAVIREWHNRNKNRVKTYSRCYHDGLKQDAFLAYGDRCKCCGESHIEFLTIDHIKGGGTKHRKTVKGGAGFYRWLKLQGYPKEDFQLLCMNCNWAKGIFGFCPHATEDYDYA